MKWMAVLFAIFTAIASFGIGNIVQANAIATLTESTCGVSPYITGAIVCATTALVILGGVKSIARIRCGNVGTVHGNLLRHRLHLHFSL